MVLIAGLGAVLGAGALAACGGSPAGSACEQEGEVRCEGGVMYECRDGELREMSAQRRVMN